MLDAPPGTSITALDLWWVRHINPVSQPPWGWLHIEAGGRWLHQQNDGLIGTYTAESPAVAYGAGNHQSFSAANARDVKLNVMCHAWCDRVGNVVAGTFTVYRLRVTLDDASAPAGTASGLLDGARVAAPVAIAAQSTDAGAGVRALSLRVDDRIVDTIAAGGHCADVDASNTDPFEYARVHPCPESLAGTLTLMPEHLPTAEAHLATVVSTDAAGQHTVLGAARVARAAPTGFRADTGFVNPDLDVTAPSVNGDNGGPARMRLAFVVKRKNAERSTRFLSRRSVRYGQRATFRGRLTTPTGRPIVGARVWRAVASKGGDWRLSGRPLHTSKTGRVTGRTPVRGGSRRMRLVYFPYRHLNGHGTTPTRLLSVRATTTIALDHAGYRNGDTARFSGRILSGPVVAQKSVHLQALVRGTWRTFDTTRADTKGRWMLRYRFSATRRLTVYRFRAVIPAETQYPWATGHSRVVRVLVAP